MKLFSKILIPSPHQGKKMLMDARYTPGAAPQPVVLFVHGFKGFKDWGHFNLVADRFAQSGFLFAKINLSHNGTTPDHPQDFVDLAAFGENNFSIELDDIGAAIDFLHSVVCPIPSTAMDLGRLYLVGHSRGGGLALLKPREDERVRGVATWAAIHDFTKRWPEATIAQWEKDGVIHVPNARTQQNMPLKYQLVEDTLKNYQRLDIPKAVREMAIPQLIVHGTDDETLFVGTARTMAGWNPNAELFVVEGANHTFGGSHPYPHEALPKHMDIVVSKTIDFFRSISKH